MNQKPVTFTCNIPVTDRRREDFDKFCDVVATKYAKLMNETGQEAAEEFLSMYERDDLLVFYGKKRGEALSDAAKRVAINRARGIAATDSLPEVLGEVMKEHEHYFNGSRHWSQNQGRKRAAKSLARFISLVMNQLPEGAPQVIVSSVASGKPQLTL